MTTRAMADGTRHPMCGVPKYTIDRYEQKLKEAGYTVVFGISMSSMPIGGNSEPDKDIPTESISSLIRQEKGFIGFITIQIRCADSL